MKTSYFNKAKFHLISQYAQMPYDGTISPENLERYVQVYADFNRNKFSSICCRIDRGEVCVLTTHTVRAKFKNRHHFSKESLADFYSAHIVPKGSPLAVQYLISDWDGILWIPQPYTACRMCFIWVHIGCRLGEYSQR